MAQASNLPRCLIPDLEGENQGRETWRMDDSMGQRKRLGGAAVVGLALALIACSDGGVGPRFGRSPFQNCKSDAGIRICLEKIRYTPNKLVVFTVANSLNRIVFEDRCGGGMDALQPSTEPRVSSGVSRICGPYATRADILAKMLPLPRGGIVFDTFPLFGPTSVGDWRVRVRILGPEAFPIRDEPFTSLVFRVSSPRAPLRINFEVQHRLGDRVR